MDLFQELFLTAAIAFLLSLIVAKLVSVAVDSGDDAKSSGNAGTENVTEEVRFEGGLRTRRSKSNKKVGFVEGAVEKVDEFEGEKSVPEIEKSGCSREEKWCDLAPVSDSLSQMEVEEVVFMEKSPEGFLREEVVVPDVVGGPDLEETKEEDIMTNVDKLIVEERSEGRKVDEFGGMEELNVVTGLVEEKIVEHAGTEYDVVTEGVANNDIVDKAEADCENVDEIVNSGSSNVVAQAVEIRDVESGQKGGTGVEEEVNEEDEKKKGLVDDDDDWEGIERSELEDDFAAAANYVVHGDKYDRKPNLESDVQLQLYGLHKVATEGPCHEPQPMALEVSARAKWNAWQRLRNTSPEVAMEQYISLLSDKVPEWMEDKTSSDGSAGSLGVSGASPPDKSTFKQNQPTSMKRSHLELTSVTVEGDLTGGSNSG